MVGAKRGGRLTFEISFYFVKKLCLPGSSACFHQSSFLYGDKPVQFISQTCRSLLHPAILRLGGGVRDGAQPDMECP